MGTVVEILGPGVYEVEVSDDAGQTYASLALPPISLPSLSRSATPRSIMQAGWRSDQNFTEPSDRAPAELRDWRIRASEETIMKSLVGDYRKEHLFTLRQSLRSYRHYQDLIQEVDKQVKKMVQQLPCQVNINEKPLPKEKKPRKTPWRNEPPQLRDDLYRAFGVDLTQIPFNTLTAQMLLTEVGSDLSRFPPAAASCSWLWLCPDPKISGDKTLSSKTRPTRNRAALALRMAAQELHRSQTFLGDYFRRMKARMGTPKAMTAAAHKLARIVYHMIANRQEYDMTVFQEQQRCSEDRKRTKLHLQARELGFNLVPVKVVA